jgi:hypothetical protein
MARERPPAAHGAWRSTITVGKGSDVGAGPTGGWQGWRTPHAGEMERGATTLDYVRRIERMPDAVRDRSHVLKHHPSVNGGQRDFFAIIATLSALLG